MKTVKIDWNTIEIPLSIINKAHRHYWEQRGKVALTKQKIEVVREYLNYVMFYVHVDHWLSRDEYDWIIGLLDDKSKKYFHKLHTKNLKMNINSPITLNPFKIWDNIKLWLRREKLQKDIRQLAI
jgi:hypothetical protein